MVTLTLDEVVRRTLHKNRLPLHYYIQFLVFGREALKEFQLTISPTMTTVQLTLDSNSEATLPADYVEEIGIYEPVGNKLSPLPHSDLISTFDYPNWVTGTAYLIGDHVNSGGFTWISLTNHTDAIVPVAGAVWSLFAKFALAPNIYMQSSGRDMSGGLAYDVHSEDTGGIFGFREVDTRSYRILRDFNKVRFDNSTLLTTVYLKYITMPVKISNQTIIHPMLEPSIVEYMNWQKAKYMNDKNQLIIRAEFYNKRRHAKAMLHPMNIQDIFATLRKHNNQTIRS